MSGAGGSAGSSFELPPDASAGAAGDDAGGDAAPSSSTESDIAAMCDKFGALACGKPAAQCVADATALLDEAEQKGCLSEYEDLLGCAAATEIVCAPDLQMPECSPEIVALNTCDPLCGGASTPGTCTQACPTWGVSCVQNGSELECSCTSGKKSGTTFSLDVSCDDIVGWTSAAKQHCA